jgi:hypothetical protein
MRPTRRLLAVILIAAMPLAANAAEQAKGQKSAGPITVGDFAVMLSATTSRGPAVDVKDAYAALVKAGVPLGNPKAVLSEQKLAEVLGYYGIRVTSSLPSQPVTVAKAESALVRLGSALNSATASTAGSTSSPGPAADVDVCLSEANHGQCVNCCKGFGGLANTCSKFCQQIKVSEGEPLP